MKTYSIEVTETLTRVIEVKADDTATALEIVNKQYDGQDIVLDYDDFSNYEINSLGEAR